MKIQCIKCRIKDTIRERVSEGEKREILCPECGTGKKKLWWNWGVVA